MVFKFFYGFRKYIFKLEFISNVFLTYLPMHGILWNTEMYISLETVKLLIL